VSATTLDEAIQAERDGADYIGVGAMIPTHSKADATLVSMDTLAAIRSAVSIPVMIIGGLHKDNLPQFANMGVNGAAVISAILAQPDIRKAAAELCEICERL